MNNKTRSNRLVAVSLVLVMLMSSAFLFIENDKDLSAEVPTGYIPVNNAADFARVASGETYGGYTWSLSAKYYQTADIILAGTNNFTPKGTQGVGNVFSGIYDGGNHKISNLNLTTSLTYAGVFGFADGGSIKNLFIENIYLFNESTGTNYTGVIGRSGTTSIDNVKVHGKIVGGYYTGGISGYSAAAITNCTNYAEIVGTQSVSYSGGITGMLQSQPQLSQCANFGNISAKYAGGIVGHHNRGAVIQCYNIGNVSGEVAGGISGNYGNATYTPYIINAYNTGVISGNMDSGSAGGITGNFFTGGTIRTSYNVGSVSGYNYSAISGSNTGTIPNETNKTVAYLSSAPLSGSIRNEIGVPLTDVQMRTQSTFDTLSHLTFNWDFSNVWKMGDGDYPYPFLIAFTEPLRILSTAPESIFESEMFTYDVITNKTGVAISVSGADWLSVSGNAISGQAPTPESGTSQYWNINVTVTVDIWTVTQSFGLRVIGKTTSEDSPEPSMTVTHISGRTYHFDGSASSDNQSLSWDLGSGVIKTDTIFTYEFPSSGLYTVALTSTNEHGSKTIYQDIWVVDSNPPETATFKKLYKTTFYIGEYESPTLQGASWLSVTDYQDGYITISGTPMLSTIVGRTYNMVLASGDTTIKTWPVTVIGGDGWPVGGFYVEKNGLEVTAVSTAEYWEQMVYVFLVGGKEYLSDGTTTHTYASPGTYTIIQRLSSYVGDEWVTVEFGRTIEVKALPIIEVPVPVEPEYGLKEQMGEFFSNPLVLAAGILAIACLILILRTNLDRYLIMILIPSILVLIFYIWRIWG